MTGFLITAKVAHNGLIELRKPRFEEHFPSQL